MAQSRGANQKPTTFSLKDLKPYEKNPRRISKKAYEKLKQSIKEDGYHCRLIADVDGTVIGGHQRIKALQELGLKEVEVLIPNRKLTPEEFDRINVRDNLPFGEFDFELLGKRFDADKLLDWGLPEEWLPKLGDIPLPDGANGKEFDETAAQGMKMATCPDCGKTFPV